MIGNNGLYSLLRVYLYLMTIFGGTYAIMETQNGLIGYDCTAADVNITSFSLIDVQPCKYETDNIVTKSKDIQVVQTNKVFNVHVFQCKVIFRRRIQYCGMHSHVSAYQNSFKYIVREFTSDECRKLHELGSLKVHGEIQISEIPRNNSKRGEVLIVGSLTGSACYGGSYFDGTLHYTDALVSMEYEIDLYDYEAKLDITENMISLRKGLVCPFKSGSCLDAKEGYTTWSTELDQDCNTGKYSVIYEGTANKTYNEKVSPDGQGGNALFSALSDNHLFSIRVKKSFEICGYPAFETDHKQIFVLEVSPGTRIIRNKNEINAKDLDLITYFNSKITVVENHLGNQLALLYKQLVNELCKVEKSLLETRLISARINPHEFASNLMKSSGYTAIIAGEIIYIIQCAPVYVTLRPSTQCFQELPVKKDNISMYMSSVTHILQRHGTEITCAALLPAKYKFGQYWYTIDGTLHQTIKPNILSSDVKSDWEYTYLPNLMSAGVYTYENLQRMHEFIYENEDRRSASTVLHRKVSGYSTDSQGFDFGNLINENVIETTIQKYWDKLMSFTTILGQFTSSLVGFWLIGKLIKFVIDSLVHCRILFDIYGISWKLVASFWDSLTSLLTYNHHTRQDKDKIGYIKGSDEIDDVPDREIMTTISKIEKQDTALVYPTINSQDGTHEFTIQISTDPCTNIPRNDRVK